jgi:hypothetical protein
MFSGIVEECAVVTAIEHDKVNVILLLHVRIVTICK